MAKLIIDGDEFELTNGADLQEKAEDWGIPFGCTEGICGTCRVVVLEGGENLTERTQEEKDAGLAPNERFACQCKLKQGTVKIEPW